MKKLILFVAVCIFFGAGNVMAQQNKSKTEVTKFLGIPVDGTKNQMIQKIKAKGFTYNQKQDRLKGKFNGRDVYVSVVTNKNKVWRIMVQDVVPSSETDIRIRFNELCRQFAENEKYLAQNLTGNYEIESDENISYNITVRNKRYQAGYFQMTEKDKEFLQDTIGLMNAVNPIIHSKYTQEELDNPTEEITQDVYNIAADYIIENLYEKIKNRSVWFLISEFYGDYTIIMYYDNELNAARGEDL
ncbi:MAG: hypothetical protein II878_01625 [Bacteroidales bacterium]|nr:hypothetical protein [Bacteroidales bacterium]